MSCFLVLCSITDQCVNIRRDNALERYIYDMLEEKSFTNWMNARAKLFVAFSNVQVSYI